MGHTGQLSSYILQKPSAVSYFHNISTVLTSTSGLGNYSLSVLTDSSIRLRSVYNKILPPAPWDTTCCPISGVRSWGFDTDYWRGLNTAYSTADDSVIIGTARGCLVYATVWRDCPALVSHPCCPLYGTLLLLTRVLAGDWLTIRQHHPHSSSYWDSILETTEEPCWEEEVSTGPFQVPDFGPIPEQRSHNRALHHDITLRAAKLP